MSFIQVQQSLVTHRKTLRLARLLSLDRYAVVGRLVALWSWCLDNALDGVLGSDIDAEVLADVMGWDLSLGKPAELLEALLTAGFLDLDPTDGRLHIHDWHEHMGRLIERREADAERHRRSRATVQATMAADAAHALAPASPVSHPSQSRPKAATAKVTPLRPTDPTVAKGGARLPDPVWDACIAAMGAPPATM